MATVGGNRRLDVQGLRAVAVLMVVAFHAGLPVPGGFVGVDVFFVISGFVITTMLQREQAATGRVRFGRFYLRRFKRLTPALAVMVVVTMLLTFLLLPPFGAQQVAANTAIGAMLLTANVVIARSTGDYFDAPAESNPLLHTWSLSVEEQFYLAFPAVLALGWMLARRGRRQRGAPLAIVGVVAAVSFGCAVAGSMGLSFKGSGTLLGFYSPVTRTWEFAAGALLGLMMSRRALASNSLSRVLGLVGAGLLAASLWLITGSTPFPGPWTLLPVVGTLLVIFAGTHNANPVTRFLSTRPMVRVGDWSYSIYLWHWPLIVFAVFLWPQTRYAALYAAAFSLIPALASYRWIEQPIRNLPSVAGPRLAALATAVVLPPLVLGGVIGAAAGAVWRPFLYESGLIPVVNEGDIGHLEFHTFVDDHYYPCTPPVIRDHALDWEGIPRCHQSQRGPDVDMALIGDSHAEHLFLGLAEALPQHNIAYYIINGLPFKSVPGMERIIDETASSPSIKTVVVNAAWGARGVHPQELEVTLRKLRESGKAVYVTDDNPGFPFDPVICKYGKAPLVPTTECSRDAREFWKAYDAYYHDLKEAVDAVPGVHLLNTARYFCNGDSCAMNRDGKLLYRDVNHLNMNGTRYLAHMILQDYPSFPGPVPAAA